jgi:hypothetical protein
VQGAIAGATCGINGSSSSRADLEVAVQSVSTTASTCWYDVVMSTVFDFFLAAAHCSCHSSCALLWPHVWLLQQGQLLKRVATAAASLCDR